MSDKDVKNSNRNQEQKVEPETDEVENYENVNQEVNSESSVIIDAPTNQEHTVARKDNHSKKKTFIICGIAIFLVLASVGGYFLYKYMKKNSLEAEYAKSELRISEIGDELDEMDNLKFSDYDTSDSAAKYTETDINNIRARSDASIFYYGLALNEEKFETDNFSFFTYLTSSCPDSDFEAKIATLSSSMQEYKEQVNKYQYADAFPEIKQGMLTHFDKLVQDIREDRTRYQKFANEYNNNSSFDNWISGSYMDVSSYKEFDYDDMDSDYFGPTDSFMKAGIIKKILDANDQSLNEIADLQNALICQKYGSQEQYDQKKTDLNNEKDNLTQREADITSELEKLK